MWIVRSLIKVFVLVWYIPRYAIIILVESNALDNVDALAVSSVVRTTTYSRISITRTPMARSQWLIRTRF